MSSLSSDQHPPPPPVTPTPSIFQSVAARAIPCVDIKPPCMSTSGRISPADSLAYQMGEQHWLKDPPCATQSLA